MPLAPLCRQSCCWLPAPSVQCICRPLRDVSIRILQQAALFCLLWRRALCHLLEHEAHWQKPHQGALVLCEQVALGVIVGPCLARAAGNQVERVGQQRQGEQQPSQLLKQLLQDQTTCQSGYQRTAQAACENSLGAPPPAARASLSTVQSGAAGRPDRSSCSRRQPVRSDVLAG